MARIALLATASLILCAPVMADTVTVHHIAGCETNRVDPNGPWFLPPGNICDHSPFHRGTWEDWGWTHNLSGLAPADANGIVSASLTIRNWGVDTNDPSGPEIDGIYAIRLAAPGGGKVPNASFHTQDGSISLAATRIGQLQHTEAYSWGKSYLTVPADVCSELLRTASLRLFMNIDEANYGRRVSLAYADLVVQYSVPHTTWEPNLPMHQFWSPLLNETFWTTSDIEKNKILKTYPPNVWTYEGIAHYTYRDKRDPNVMPIYRFWSRKGSGHFFTMSEGERDKLLASCEWKAAVTVGYPQPWIYEGIAFYAQMPGRQDKNAIPVYRFWSGTLSRHVYTTNEAEKTELSRMPTIWQYEGIAWYVQQ
jgi:hypothetical protein